MSIKIVTATTDQTSIIASILTDATRYKNDRSDTSWGSGAFTDKEVAEQMAAGSVYLAYLGDTPVGTATLQWQDERIWGPQPSNAGYLHRLAVKDGLHGQKVGAQLINWLADEVAKHKRQFLRLDCDSRNAKLCAYYEKQGFVRVGHKVALQYGDYLATLYERSLQ